MIIKSLEKIRCVSDLHNVHLLKSQGFLLQSVNDENQRTKVGGLLPALFAD